MTSTESRSSRLMPLRAHVIRLLPFLLMAPLALVRGQFDPLGAPPAPAENPPSEAKRILGKILFWEEQLSSDDTIACGTCHIPAFAGADPRVGIHPGPDEAFGTEDDVLGSPGVVRRDVANQPIEDPVFGFEPQVTGRAAQSYFASAWSSDNFWDGRALSRFVDPLDPEQVVIESGGGLESQAVGPIVGLGVVQLRKERMLLDAGIDRPALRPAGGQVVHADVLFKDVEDRVLSGAQGVDVSTDRGVVLADAHEQVDHLLAKRVGAGQFVDRVQTHGARR